MATYSGFKALEIHSPEDAMLNCQTGSENFSLKYTDRGSHDVVCFSHLRWDFVYQRPQHLLSRCAQSHRVFFVEEPIDSSNGTCALDVSRRECGVWVVVPRLPKGVSEGDAIALQRHLVDILLTKALICDPILWYYTPMAIPFTDHLIASAVIYDCMDELSAFRGAHPELQSWETHLFKISDLVFTGGMSLYEVKRLQHPNVYAFPSSINIADFAQARSLTEDPEDQDSIPHPRLGFYGVIDERMDLALIDGIAKARPDWHLVMIGPVAKIDPKNLPDRPNIHYLGGKSYPELPRYLAGWDVALLPFARNESTRFISPTKTPEYLAAGKPVVSTSIHDVVRPYGEYHLVQIADSVPDFVEAVSLALSSKQPDSDWLSRVDKFLSQTSWDCTWQAMNGLISSVTEVQVRRVQQQEAISSSVQSGIKQSLSTNATATSAAI
jgi:glycosyltransferase involved in cell wall biosynthesis